MKIYSVIILEARYANYDCLVPQFKKVINFTTRQDALDYCLKEISQNTYRYSEDKIETTYFGSVTCIEYKDSDYKYIIIPNDIIERKES